MSLDDFPPWVGWVDGESLNSAQLGLEAWAELGNM